MERQIMLGRISSIDYKKGCADVVFPDADDEIKTELPFLSMEYSMPEINEIVVVIFQRHKNRSQGFILGSVFNSGNIPEFSGKGAYFKRLSKEAYIKYETETRTLEICAPKINLVQRG